MNYRLETGAEQMRRSFPDWMSLQRHSPKLFRSCELRAEFSIQLMHHQPHAWRRLEVVPNAEDEGMDDLVLRDATDEQLIIEWALLVGDALHNARSALDHAIWQLVELNGGTPGTSTQFPTTRRRTRVDQARQLDGVHPLVQHAVLTLEPWEGGAGHWLWVLAQLDNVDKHRLLLDMDSFSNTTFAIQDRATDEWVDESLSTEGFDAGQVVRTAPRGTMKSKMTTSTLFFASHAGDVWNGLGPNGYKLPAEMVLHECVAAAGAAHMALGVAFDEAKSAP